MNRSGERWDVPLPEMPAAPADREGAELTAKQLWTLSAGCPNPWHVTAPARLGHPCPECPTPELGDDLAVILCACGRWWQADPDAPAEAPAACLTHAPRVIVLTAWEEGDPA